jgi:hypothetical protein
MTRFSTFALLYMAALVLELAERWPHERFATGIFLLVGLIIWRGLTPGRFFLFLAATTAYFVLLEFPDVANHLNIALYCNVLLMVGIGYAWARKTRFQNDDDLFELVRPILQISLVLVYSLAGFHKLNADFVDVEVSCAARFLGFFDTMARSELFGIPTVLIVAAGLLPAAYQLLSRSRWRRHLPLIGIALGIVLVGIVALVVLRPAIGSFAPVFRVGILAMAIVIITWELGGGLLLAVPRFQAAMLAFSWTMHAMLAPINFVDFGALVFALLFTFVPRPWFDLLNGPVRLPIVGLPVRRVYLYGAINVLAAVAGSQSLLLKGLIFNVAALAFIWPLIVAAIAPPPRPAWAGVPLSSRLTPRWMLVFPAVLLLHGLTPYLGLRTTGNFSMFSNLRTEGARSNHFLLGSNPLKLWGYQEDVVAVTRIDDMRARIGHQYHVLQGNRLPVVEFRKLIYAWTRAGAVIPMTFEYRGRVHSTPDIVNDPDWRVQARDWEMRTMDFRAIQPAGPNRCRW